VNEHEDWADSQIRRLGLFPDEPRIRETITRYELTMMPEDDINECAWYIAVELRAAGRYAVVRGKLCLTPGVGWHAESRDPDGDCIRYHRYPVGEALALAREHLPFLRINGQTSMDVLAAARVSP
jgi:hypothetical protein